MTLNPITALSEQIQKLINEHGSATILRDHLAMFKDQVVLLEKKNADLTSENAILKSKIQVLERKQQDLVEENETFRREIQRHDQSAQCNPLDEIKEKILLLLSEHQELSTKSMAKKLSMKLQEIEFHLQELLKVEMVHDSPGIGSPTTWSLEQEGRRYLIEHKLIS